MYKYQNTSDIAQTIVVEGNITPRIVEPGQTVETDVAIENPNFKYLGELQADSAGINAVQVKQENAVTEATPAVNPQEGV